MGTESAYYKKRNKPYGKKETAIILIFFNSNAGYQRSKNATDQLVCVSALIYSSFVPRIHVGSLS